MAVVVDSDWRREILHELRLRNKRENGGFSELIVSRNLPLYYIHKYYIVG